MPLIGVAIAIPEPYGSELREARARFGDALAAAIPTHVTLLPPTEVATGELPKAQRHLEDIAGSVQPFELRLRGTGTFRPISPVVFIRIAAGGDSCTQIQAHVRSGPLSRDLDFPYAPHVTVAHHLPDLQLDAAATELATYDVTIEVTSFSHYRHGADGVWRPECEYAFGRPGEGRFPPR